MCTLEVVVVSFPILVFVEGMNIIYISEFTQISALGAGDFVMGKIFKVTHSGG